MADISKEIQAFQDAEYGEEVRGSMISLAEKVNDEVVKGTVDAKAAAQNANKAAADADAIRQDLQYKKETDYWRGRPGESGITALASGMFTLALDRRRMTCMHIIRMQIIPPHLNMRKRPETYTI